MSIGEIMRYVYVTFCVTFIFFIPVMLIRYYLMEKRFRNDSLKHEIASIFFVFYLLALYQITAFRLGGLGWNLENMLARRTRVNDEPLVLIWDWTVKGVWWHLFYNVIGNCIWFIPLGVMLPAIYREFRKKPLLVIFVGMAVSSSIEILQYILCTGVTDIDDVLFNTIGTAMGYWVWLFLEKQRNKKRLLKNK